MQRNSTNEKMSRTVWNICVKIYLYKVMFVEDCVTRISVAVRDSTNMKMSRTCYKSEEIFV